MKKNIVLIIICLFCGNYIANSRQDSSNTSARKPTFSSPSKLGELQKDIDAILDSPELSNAFVGVSVVNIETGEIFYRHNDYKNFVPASALKLLTTASALEYLGPEFHFSTKIYLNGVLSDNGEYNGDIIVRAGGDPSISVEYYDDPGSVFSSIVNTLDSLGIKSINGNIIGDDNYFDNEQYAPGWAWDDFMYPFSAQIGALSAYNNSVELTMKPDSKIGHIAEYSIEPNTKYVQVFNNIRTTSANEISDVTAYKTPYTNFIYLGGHIRKDSLNREEVHSAIAIDNPTLFFLHLLKDCIAKHNILFRGALFDIDDYHERISYPDLHLISTILSPPLKNILEKMNQNSNNLTAEIVLKTIAKEMCGEGSFQKGIEYLMKTAVKAGISSDKINLFDGSGLSRMNIISPKSFISLLMYMYNSNFRQEYISTLATPGEKGTLKRRMTKSAAHKNLWAKSGSMNNTNNLCGYVRTKDNENLAFSIMIMNNTVPLSVSSNIIDTICNRLAAFSKK